MAEDCEASQGCMNDGSIYLYPESASSLTLKIEFSVEMDYNFKENYILQHKVCFSLNLL